MFLSSCNCASKSKILIHLASELINSYIPISFDDGSAYEYGSAYMAAHNSVLPLINHQSKTNENGCHTISILPSERKLWDVFYSIMKYDQYTSLHRESRINCTTPTSIKAELA